MCIRDRPHAISLPRHRPPQSPKQLPTSELSLEERVVRGSAYERDPTRKDPPLSDRHVLRDWAGGGSIPSALARQNSVWLVPGAVNRDSRGWSRRRDVAHPRPPTTRLGLS